MKSPLKPWRLLREKMLYRAPFFDIQKRHFSSPLSRRKHDFYVMDCRDWVNILARTKKGTFIAVRQFRAGARSLTLEIPGGALDRRREPPLCAAKRELAEETGYRAKRWTLLGVVEPNPAILTNRCYTFLAQDAYPAGEPSPDPTEELEVMEISETSLAALVRQGKIRHALVVAAFFLWQAFSARKKRSLRRRR